MRRVRSSGIRVVVPGFPAPRTGICPNGCRDRWLACFSSGNLTSRTP